jgi:hypothetical protein
MKLHLTLAFGLAICLAAGGYELYRALGGNTLSWAYVFEWPLFGAFGVYLWWKLLHEDPSEPSRPRKEPAAMTEEEAERLDAWNRYLAELHASEADGADGPPTS